MTFTEFEYLLMLAVAVLLWRNAKLDQAETDAINEANKYAHFLMSIGRGEGKVVFKNGIFKFEEIKHENKNI